MGVGYGMWSDSLNIGVNITTAEMFIDKEVEYTRGDLSISGDEKTILITGEVYPSFRDDIKINIINGGTIPFVLEDIAEDVANNDIAELNQIAKPGFGLFSSIIEEDVVETFSLNISPPEVEAEIDLLMLRMPTFSVEQYTEEDNWYQNEINRLENEINLLHTDIKEIQNEIDSLNVTEKYNFEYELQFIQGI